MLEKNNTIFFEGKKNKAFKICFYLLLFFVFLTISVLFVGKLNSSQHGDLFGADARRVMNDWTSFFASHYRTKVHPLYVLLIFPFTYTLRFIFNSKEIACALFISIMSVLNVFLMDKLLLKLSKQNAKNNCLRALFVFMYATMFVVLMNVIMVESFIVGVVTLLLFWNYFVSIRNKKLTAKNYFVLICLGVLCFAMLTTNIVHFAIGLLFLFVLNRKKSVEEFILDLGKSFTMVLIVVGLTWFLGIVQTAIFKSAQNGVKYGIDMLISVLTKSNSVEDVGYIVPFTFQNFVRAFGATFSNAFMAAGVEASKSSIQFAGLSTINYIQIAIVAVLLIYSAVSLIKNKKFSIALPFILAFAFEFVFHLFYGNNEMMLYESQIIFSLIVLMYVGLAADNSGWSALSFFALITLVVLNVVYNCIALIKISEVLKVYNLNLAFNFSKSFVLLLAEIVVMAAFVALVFFMKKHCKKEKSKRNSWSVVLWAVVCIFVLVSQCLIPVSFLTINQKYIYNDNYPIFLGMGLRKKFLIEKQDKTFNLFEYDLDNKNRVLILDDLTLLDYNAQDYTASLKRKGQKISVYENEEGVFMNVANEVTALDDSVHINIPSFENYEYSSYLKILFHETMVNITEYGPSPSFLSYGNIWYRDGAIMSMVAEKTDNVDQLQPWLNSLNETNVYDHARAQTNNIEGLVEADNLGEMLFMLSLAENPNQNLINAIIDEANNIKVEGKSYIQGITDFAQMPAYQTKWLLFGLNKLGLGDMGFALGDATDRYEDLCWFYDPKQKQDFKGDFLEISLKAFDPAKEACPYLSFAKVHYYNMKVDIPTNLVYPISFEGYLKGRKEVSPHGWAAAELFLYLLDYASFE